MQTFGDTASREFLLNRKHEMFLNEFKNEATRPRKCLTVNMKCF